MKNRLKQIGWWLVPPERGEDEAGRRVYIVHVIAFAILAAAIFGLLIEWLTRQSQFALPLLAGVLASIVSLWLNRRGQSSLAGFLLVGIVLTIVTVVLMDGLGLHGIAIMLYPLVMILISLLFDRRGVFLGFAAVLVSVAVVAFGEVYGLYEVDIAELVPSPVDFLTVSTILLVTGVGLSLVHGYLNRSIERARENAQALHTSEERFRSLAENAPNLILNLDRQGTILYSNKLALAPVEIVEGHNIYEYIMQDQHEVARQFLETAFQTGDVTSYEGQILSVSGAKPWYSFRLSPIFENGKVASIVLIATSIQERIEIEEKLKRRTDQLATLNQIAVAISGLRDLKGVLDEIQAQLREALPMDTFYVALLDESGTQATFPIMVDAGERYTGEPLTITPGNWIDMVVKTRQPLLLNRSAEEIQGVGSEHRMGDVERVSASIMMMPLIVEERTIGVVSAQSYTLDAYGQEQLDFLQSAASQIAIAVDNARLYDGLQNELAEHARSASALRQSEARMRVIIENFPYDLWMCNTEGEYIMQSQLSLRLAGNIIGKKVKDLNVTEDVRSRWAALHKRVLAGEIVMDEGAWPVEGELRSFVTLLAPVQDDGKELGFMGLNIDITDLKLSEERIHRYATRIEVLHELDQAILTVRSSQEIAEAALLRLPLLINCNSASLALLDEQASTVQVIATYTLGETKPGSGDRLAFSDPINLARLAQGQTLYLTNLVTQPLDGSVSLNKVLMKGSIRAAIVVPLLHQKKLIGVLSIGAERTGQLSQDDVLVAQEVATQLAIAIFQAQLTSDIQQLNAKLEQRVQERTADLQAAVKELETFSYSVSHDLRAPLRAVIGYLQLFMAEYGSKLEEEAQNYLKNVQTGAFRMNQLIDDMLNLARVGRQDLDLTTFSLTELFKEVLDVALSGKNSERFQISVPLLPDVTADRGLLRQVCQNLIDNAIKYSRKRSVSKIEVGSLEENGQLIFYVRDNGTGFDMKFSGRLFKAFERLHQQDEYEGTGVGLAIVQRILHRHGGRIWVKAAQDEGATFYFTLGK